MAQWTEKSQPKLHFITQPENPRQRGPRPLPSIWSLIASGIELLPIGKSVQIGPLVGLKLPTPEPLLLWGRP